MGKYIWTAAAALLLLGCSDGGSVAAVSGETGGLAGVGGTPDAVAGSVAMSDGAGVGGKPASGGAGSGGEMTMPAGGQSTGKGGTGGAPANGGQGGSAGAAAGSGGSAGGGGSSSGGSGGAAAGTGGMSDGFTHGAPFWSIQCSVLASHVVDYSCTGPAYPWHCFTNTAPPTVEACSLATKQPTSDAESAWCCTQCMYDDTFDFGKAVQGACPAGYPKFRVCAASKPLGSCIESAAGVAAGGRCCAS